MKYLFIVSIFIMGCGQPPKPSDPNKSKLPSTCIVTRSGDLVTVTCPKGTKITVTSDNPILECTGNECPATEVR